ncbi:hypothetical protein HPB52_006223 [Rhipicephalus sanguineus]|uniref:CCHC-type domain-containing protein n=1 Tax=Rhipicephalus sanguineus TaxID=34632 RepID=A0A9D4PM11_RHISA|nr:hypothetical protein HPB52_006223 [Rhipicephalus sanguineus]
MLSSMKLLTDVVALVAYRMSHVWAVTFKSCDAVKELLRAKEVNVKDSRCIVIDPGNQALHLKLHWMLHTVPDDDICEALAPYGRVTDVAREKWRVLGLQDKGSSTRLVTLVPRKGLGADDVPHLLRIAGEEALVVIPGRAPLCLRCRNTGHIRRDCRVPRCTRCRRHGHEEFQCVRTYANVAVPTAADENAELLMDEVEAEEASAGSVKEAKASATQSAKPQGQTAGAARGPGTPSRHVNKDSTIDVQKKDTATKTAPDISESAGSEPLDVSKAGGSIGKRTREESTNDGTKTDAMNSEEPPQKSAGMRRSSIRPTPNIPPDKRTAETAPKQTESLLPAKALGRALEC